MSGHEECFGLSLPESWSEWKRVIRFRSVVHSDILSERPATLGIILMPRVLGMDGMLKPARNDPHRPPVRVDKCAEHVQQLGSESLLPNLMGVKG